MVVPIDGFRNRPEESPVAARNRGRSFRSIAVLLIKIVQMWREFTGNSNRDDAPGIP